MDPAYKNFTVEPNEAFDYSFTFYQGAPGSQAAVDLTRASATLNIVDGFGLTLLELTNQSGPVNELVTGIYFGGEAGTPTNGIIDLIISATNTAAITWHYATYTLSVTTQSLGQQEVLYGSFVLAGFTP